jgi:hypothetical protein
MKYVLLAMKVGAAISLVVAFVLVGFCQFGPAACCALTGVFGLTFSTYAERHATGPHSQDRNPVDPSAVSERT